MVARLPTAYTLGATGSSGYVYSASLVYYTNKHVAYGYAQGYARVKYGIPLSYSAAASSIGSK